METMKLSVLFVGFSYGGNGGISSQHPDVARWQRRAMNAAMRDPRIDKVMELDLSDTPITMTRNKAVLMARECGADVLIMVDSDQSPDMYQDAPGFKPFFESSFDFLYENWHKFSHGCIIGSPYCGPPAQEENCYVFYWKDFISNSPDTNFKLEAYTRNQAADMVGIQECGALPTGLIMCDMRAFTLTEPKAKEPGHEDMEGDKPWFYYEWSDHYCAEKGSTEDVTFSRDISLAGSMLHGYNPVFCNWDSWAGHWKPKLVGKPSVMTADAVGSKLRRAIQEGRNSRIGMGQVGGNRDMVEFDRKVAAAKSAQQQPDIRKVQFTPSSVCQKLDDGLQEARATGLVLPGNHFTPTEDLQALTSIVAKAASLAKDRRLVVVEVGSWVGQSALALRKGFGPTGGVVHCVDTWEGTPGDVTGQLREEMRGSGDSPYHCFLLNAGSHLGREIVPHKADSLAAAFAWPFPIDVLYLDGDHSYEGVKADLEAWLPHVREGGIVSGHDYRNPSYPGVQQAVDEMLGDSVSVVDGMVWCTQVASSKIVPTNGELVHG